MADVFGVNNEDHSWIIGLIWDFSRDGCLDTGRVTLQKKSEMEKVSVLSELWVGEQKLWRAVAGEQKLTWIKDLNILLDFKHLISGRTLNSQF